MNEFLEQFLLEAREHSEIVSVELLALEKSPGDKERLALILRALHTLKGGAGIVDFSALASLAHYLEGILSAARNDGSALTSEVVGKCFAGLDQMDRWLEVIERTGELPEDADVELRSLARTFQEPAEEPRQSPPLEGSGGPGSWLQTLLAKYPDARKLANTAIRYAPDHDCFFAGVDPIACVGKTHGLLALDVIPAVPWPPLESIDPFKCYVVLFALSRLSPTAVAIELGDIVNDCEIQALADHQPVTLKRSLSGSARELLQAQLHLLFDDRIARWSSAGVVAVNVLRYSGRNDDADRISHTLAESIGVGSPNALRETIQSILADPRQVSAATADVSPSREGIANTLRIDAARVDALVALTGELVVAKNAFGYAVKVAQDSSNVLAGMLKERHAVLERLVRELQQSVLGMRVRPLHTVFQRFPRLTREISTEIGKPTNLVIEGGETEADKTIVEMLFEPLLHALRNALDHGIEDAPSRAARGKPAAATIVLRAARQGEHIVVEVSDDGGGVDIARVRQVASEREIGSTETLSAMSEAELIELLFTPGFTTSKELTQLSGRGVGLDSVRTAVQRVGGQVDMESRAGHGTVVRFTLPFSVMVTRILLVSARDQMFGIPLDSVVETLRVDKSRIAGIGSAQAISIRDRVVPLVALDDEMGLPGEAPQRPDAMIVVAKVNGSLGALRVDAIGERMEVMLKPLEGLLANTRGIAGSTLLGDGNVLLLLDLEEIFA